MAGPQQREIGSPIPTNNASWRGPNTEAGEKSAYKNVQVGGAPTERNRITNFNRQCKLGWGPTQKLAKSQHTKMCKLAGPQQ
ncbi:hypothetical protein, partial [Staphylococcus aureus]|uniref:hypothetical protein n=1 Tax=Staphylococcus aureus TaxID=1280 RepID=UPI0012434E61